MLLTLLTAKGGLGFSCRRSFADKSTFFEERHAAMPSYGIADHHSTELLRLLFQSVEVHHVNMVFERFFHELGRCWSREPRFSMVRLCCASGCCGLFQDGAGTRPVLFSNNLIKPLSARFAPRTVSPHPRCIGLGRVGHWFHRLFGARLWRAYSNYSPFGPTVV